MPLRIFDRDIVGEGRSLPLARAVNPAPTSLALGAYRQGMNGIADGLDTFAKRHEFLEYPRLFLSQILGQIGQIAGALQWLDSPS